MYQFLFVSHFICLFYFQTFIDTLVWLKCFFLLPLLKKIFLQSNNFIINILCSVINPLKKQHFVAIWQRMRLNVKQNVYRYKLGVIDGTCMVTSAKQFISITYLKNFFRKQWYQNTSFLPIQEQMISYIFCRHSNNQTNEKIYVLKTILLSSIYPLNCWYTYLENDNKTKIVSGHWSRWA